MVVDSSGANGKIAVDTSSALAASTVK